MKEYTFKGTPGNWSDMSGDNASIDIVLDNAATISVDRINRYDGQLVGERSEMEANAHLIAAAPDLLQACIDFVNKVDSGRAKSTDSYNQMKAAIHKALNL